MGIKIPLDRLNVLLIITSLNQIFGCETIIARYYVNSNAILIINKKNKQIKKANDEYEYLTGEDEERRLAFLRDKAIRDEKSMREAGKEEGREEGERKKQIEIAQKLLKIKMPIEQIIEVTGLTKEKIEELNK